MGAFTAHDGTLSLGALLQLGVDVHGHLGVRMPDLTHHPQDVEPVGQQRDRNVRAAQLARASVAPIPASSG